MSLSTLVVMTPLTLQNSLIKHITLCHRNRTLFLHIDIIFVYLHIIWNKSHGLKSILVDFYNGALHLQTHTQKAKVLAATFPFSPCPYGRPQQSTACSGLHHPCCTSGFLYSVLLIRWTHKTGPPTAHHPQTGFYFERETFLKWVTKKLQDKSFWHDRLYRSWAAVT